MRIIHSSPRAVLLKASCYHHTHFTEGEAGSERGSDLLTVHSYKVAEEGFECGSAWLRYPRWSLLPLLSLDLVTDCHQVSRLRPAADGVANTDHVPRACVVWGGPDVTLVPPTNLGDSGRSPSGSPPPELGQRELTGGRGVFLPADTWLRPSSWASSELGSCQQREEDFPKPEMGCLCHC